MGQYRLGGKENLHGKTSPNAAVARAAVPHRRKFFAASEGHGLTLQAKSRPLGRKNHLKAYLPPQNCFKSALEDKNLSNRLGGSQSTKFAL